MTVYLQRIYHILRFEVPVTRTLNWKPFFAT